MSFNSRSMRCGATFEVGKEFSMAILWAKAEMFEDFDSMVKIDQLLFTCFPEYVLYVYGEEITYPDLSSLQSIRDYVFNSRSLVGAFECKTNLG